MKGFRQKPTPSKKETAKSVEKHDQQLAAVLQAQQFLVQQLQRVGQEYQMQSRELAALQNLVGTEQAEVIEANDVALINFAGVLDETGLPFDGGTSKKTAIRIGSNQFVPGFEDQLIGLRVGDFKEIKISFPEEYHEALKGKDATFYVQVADVLRDRVNSEAFDKKAEELHNLKLAADQAAAEAAKQEEGANDESQDEASSSEEKAAE